MPSRGTTIWVEIFIKQIYLLARGIEKRSKQTELKARILYFMVYFLLKRWSFASKLTLESNAGAIFSVLEIDLFMVIPCKEV